MRASARTVSLGNGVFALVLVAVLAAIALVVRPPAPPGIAEFAPQATKPISKAPPGQASRSGEGTSGDCNALGGCEVTSTPTPRPMPSARSSTAGSAPSALQCYRWPDGSVTQTFDPQSPPCVATWPDAQRGNGGATAPGVSATQIRVGWPADTDPDPKADPARHAMVDFFNTHFQLYGRKIVLVPYGPPSTGSGSRSAEAQHADARRAREKSLFASLDYDAAGKDSGDPAPLLTALSQERIVNVTGFAGFRTENQYAQLAPYSFHLQATWEHTQQALAGVVCRQLAGHPAAYSPDYRTVTRRFGVLIPSADAMGGAGRPSAQVLADGLRACGVRVATADAGAGGCTSSDATGKQQMVTWKQQGITTVLWITAQSLGSSQPMCDASAVDYTPEWFASGTGHWAQIPSGWTVQPPTQLKGLMSLYPGNPYLPFAREPFVQALAAMRSRPEVEVASLKLLYGELQAIASGVQMAGPRVTASSFASGLHDTDFPNPGSGGAPYYQAGMDTRSTRGFFDDFALGWWNPSARSYDFQIHPNGAFCFVAKGSRWRAGDMPNGDQGFFDAARSSCV